ncbi:hypothetical protein DBR40_05025 [Pedobacter sp. KBW01]|uniref:hypothetical protein n=1 Tax=Pedobacter sp. KBW01 TaxID=2153364 RepID=UPI000F5B85A4|nr:hypothetical protein [Pedobacter sp. KBW01]RQO79085.1 hypothetical protein DBR40_05025 [Pedobacter sp. KBW01]
MIEKYKSEILQAYEQKRDAGVLSPNLIHLTPANIRKEACLLLSAGCDNTDIRMLKEFLDLPFKNSFQMSHLESGILTNLGHFALF